MYKRSGLGCYYEEHDLCCRNELIIDGSELCWTDYDAKRHRIVFARVGMIYAISLKRLDESPQLLADFNSMEYETIKAPY